MYKGVLYGILLYWRSSSDPATALKAGNKAGNVAVLPAHLSARKRARWLSVTDFEVACVTAGPSIS